MTDAGIYAGLWLSAFLAATLLPAQSEAGLAFLVASGDYSLVLLVLVASFGNIAGAVVNWLLGRQLERFEGRRWFPVKTGPLARAKQWYGKFGIWSLLLSWMPIIGDPLTLVAGFFRVPLGWFLLVVTCAKTGRYLVVAALALEMF